MADASNADFSGAQAAGVNWHMSVMHKAKWTGANLKNSHWVHCDLAHADFSDADCSQANLAGASMHSIMQQNTRWDGANLNGVRPTDPALQRAEQWQPKPVAAR
jgi:uncharacterized protein YjbI with pentapeptide repeats